jgi:hypothetical protein
MEQIETSIDRYLSALDAADRQEGEVAQAKAVRLKDKIAALKQQMQQFKQIKSRGAYCAGSTDFAHRSRRPSDGHERQGHWDRRLQRAGSPSTRNTT